jgi:energy-coupling factor transporter ATP-binding protein EcfA2
VITITKGLIEACAPFDYIPTSDQSFDAPNFNTVKQDGSWGIGLIVGNSGSGKTTILRRNYNVTPKRDWSMTLPILSEFETEKIGVDKLNHCGLSSVPAWCLPHRLLSTGEQHRADIAMAIGDDAVIDEFTSTVDRATAKSISKSLSIYVRKAGITGVVLSTCHYDVIDWLDPDWVFDASKGEFIPRGFLRQFPRIEIDVTPCHYSEWKAFSKHHYLSANINKSSRCWIAWWGNVKVGFVASLVFPSRDLKNAWRESRVVILPEFQGLGVGKALSNTVAQFFIDEGCRYFSKTAHPKLGESRQKDGRWRATSTNLVSRTSYKAVAERLGDGKQAFGGFSSEYYKKHLSRLCYSHEYIGSCNG